MIAAKQQNNIVRRYSRNKQIARTVRMALFGLFLVLAVLTPLLYTRGGARVHAAPNNQINFQARLLAANGSVAPDSNTYAVEFKLYSAASGGTALWTESLTSQSVKNGYLSVSLGTVTPFPGTIDWSEQLWLTMNINGDGEMNPRLRLTAVPLAMRAKQADGITNGASTLTANDITQLAPGTAQVVNSALAALRLNQTGAGGLIQFQNNGSDVFAVANNGDLTTSGSATFAGGTLNLGTASQSGGLVLSDGSGNTATLVSGALGQDTVYTLPDPGGGTATICLSTGNCGGSGDISQGGNTLGAAVTIGTNDAYALNLETGGTTQLTIDTSGNVDILNGGLYMNGVEVITNAGVLQNVTANTSILTSGILSVPRGGTGLSSVNTNALVFGNGTGALQQTNAGTGGQVLVANNLGVPTFMTITGDVSFDPGGLATIANNAITTAKIADGSVTNDKLQNSSINLSYGTNLSGDSSVALGGTLNLAISATPTFTSINTGALNTSGALMFDSFSGAAGLLEVDASGNVSVADLSDFETPITFNNGLTRTGDTVALGGNLTGATTIGLTGNALTFTGSNGAVMFASTGSATFGASGTGLTVTNDAVINGTLTGMTSLTTQSATVSGLTANRLVWATTGGQLTTAAITSANIAASVSNETGTGALVFGTNPTFTGGVLTGTTGAFNVFNTNATTVNAFGAATTINLGAGTGTTTINNNLDVDDGLVVGAGNAFQVDSSGAVTAVGVNAGTGLIQGTGGLSITGNSSIAGTLSGLTGISTTGTLTFNSFSGTAGLLKVDTSGNVSVSTAGTDYEVPLTFGNGLTRASNNVVFGGALSQATELNLDGNNLAFTGNGNIGIGTTADANYKLTVSGGTLGLQVINDSYSLFSSTGGSYGYVRAVTTSDSAGRFELGAYDAAGSSQGTRDLVLNPIGGNVGIGGDLTPDAVFSVGSTSQFQVDGSGNVIAAGLNNTNGGITNTGSIAGATTINASGLATITGGANITGNIALGNGSGTFALNSSTFDVSSAGALSGITTISMNGGITAATSNTINGLNISSGSLSGVTGFSQTSGVHSVTGTGAITLGGGSNALTINSTNFDVSSAGALSGITTISASGLITGGGVTSNGALNVIGGDAHIQQTGTGAALIINRTDGVVGSLKSGGAKVAFFFDETGTFSISKDSRTNILSGSGAGTDVFSINAAGAVSFAGSLSGITTISMSGGITAATSNTINGLSISSGSLSGVTGFSQTSGTHSITGTGAITIGGGSNALTINSTNFDVSSAGAVSGVSTISASGLIAGSGFQAGSFVGVSVNCTGGGANNDVVKSRYENGILVSQGGCASPLLSDQRLKKNVDSLDNSILDQIKNVRTVNFDFDCTNPIFHQNGGNLACDDARQTGVIAQELAQVFPELVYQEEDGYYRVKYDALSVYTLKATSEIARTIDSSQNVRANNIKTNNILRLSNEGILQNITGLNMIGGGASLVGGLNNNNGGITHAGAISGATTIAAETITLTANATGNLLELKKDEKGVFTVFNNGAMLLQLDSHNIFAVKDANGTHIFNIDSITGRVKIGSGDDNKTVLFVLDNRSLPDDPPGIMGASYFNTKLERFRCYDGKWRDCLPAGDLTDPFSFAKVSWQLPYGDSEYPDTPRIVSNLERTHEYRLRMRIISPASAGATCRIQFAEGDAGPWHDIAEGSAGELVIDTVGTLRTDWLKLTKDARKEDMTLRVMCRGGNANQTVVFNGVSMQLR